MVGCRTSLPERSRLLTSRNCPNAPPMPRGIDSMTLPRSLQLSLCAAFLAASLALSGAAAATSDSGGGGNGLTVVLDPGHGGFDRGGIPGQRVAEKNMNLELSL